MSDAKTEKPSTAKPGWEKQEIDPRRKGTSALDALGKFQETFDGVTEADWEELPPNTNEGIDSAGCFVR